MTGWHVCQMQKEKSCFISLCLYRQLSVFVLHLQKYCPLVRRMVRAVYGQQESAIKIFKYHPVAAIPVEEGTVLLLPGAQDWVQS